MVSSPIFALSVEGQAGSNARISLWDEKYPQVTDAPSAEDRELIRLNPVQSAEVEERC
jgi:hypothetical protein